MAKTNNNNNNNNYSNNSNDDDNNNNISNNQLQPTKVHTHTNPLHIIQPPSPQKHPKQKQTQ